ncbi:hypothetical protein GCM10023188_32690 [Pontibacter saemangeumensis]|uniref:Peptidase S12 Pab87-related C-terminal domain-containing protein n=2 Tax=Pontibacter saemangeumensis TaxID=1084525 RepID=A0ABP8LYG6_9BACT
MLVLSPTLLLAAPTPQDARGVNSHLPLTTASTPTNGALQQFAGIYKLDEQFAITVSVEGEKLYGLAPGDAEKTEFTPVSENKFIIKGPETEVEFVKEDGKVKYMLVQMQGGLKLTKVE